MWLPLHCLIVGVVVLTTAGHSDGGFQLSQTGAPNGVIVQLFEWRFDDIAKECEEFLGPTGYAGVQVSPITENVIIPFRPWYERYQPISYKIVTRSGDEAAFRDMVTRCNKVGVKIYVDVVLNHMARGYKYKVTGTGGSVADPTRFNYPGVPYTADDFHSSSCLVNNWGNAKNVRDCEFLGLQDLDHSKIGVRFKIREFLNKLVSAGVAGFRVDSAKHMWPDHLTQIFSRLRYLNTSHGFACESEPFLYLHYAGTAAEGEMDAKQYYPLGMVTDFKYGYELSRAFRGKNNLKWFETFGKKWGLLDSAKALVFINDHNTARGDGLGEHMNLNHHFAKEYKMAIAFMLAWPYGSPSIYSGYYFNNKDQGAPTNDKGATTARVQHAGDLCTNGWSCEHRWRQIYQMVEFHNVVRGTPVQNWWTNGVNQIAFSRGNKGFIVFNADFPILNARLKTGLPDGTYCNVIDGRLVNGKCSGTRIKIQGGEGNFLIKSWEQDGVVAIHVGEKES